MREGKISQAVLDRSVLRTIRSKNAAVVLGAEIGRDASILKADGASGIVTATRSVCVNSIYQLQSAFVNVVNHIACGGGVAEAVMVSIVFPENGEEKFLKHIMKMIDGQCEHYGMQIMGGHTTVSRDVEVAVVTLTATGTKSVIDFIPKAQANQDVVITKWIALEGTAYAARKYYSKLEAKLPKHLIDEASRFDELADVSNEACCSYELGATAVHDGGEGGIFAALWEFAYASKVGIEVDIRKIPIRQETVEICEYLHINPYELYSAGSAVIAVDNGEELCRKLMQKGICSVVVGRTTDKNDRILINEDEVRHLTPAALDYIYQI